MISCMFTCSYLLPTADKLQLLLELESKHGPLEGFKPALDDVLSYLHGKGIHTLLSSGN